MSEKYECSIEGCTGHSEGYCGGKGYCSNHFMSALNSLNAATCKSVKYAGYYDNGWERKYVSNSLCVLNDKVGAEVTRLEAEGFTVDVQPFTPSVS